MIQDAFTPRRWPPGAPFWRNHLLFPLLAAVVLITLFENTGLDLWIADRWFTLEGGAWAWRDSWIAYDLIHHHGKQMLIAIAAGLIVTLILGRWYPNLKAWRRPICYLLTCMLILPAIIAYSKHYSHVPCPWDLARYGAEAEYKHSLLYPISISHQGHCFPSGHSSGGFALFAVYFAAYMNVRRPLKWLLPGLLVGGVFALGQQARGAHFVSHDLWTIAWCWFGSLALFALFRPVRRTYAESSRTNAGKAVEPQGSA